MKIKRFGLIARLGLGTVLAVVLISSSIGSTFALNSELSAAVFHTCTLTASGGVQCWGYNNYGQLGDGTMTDRTYPINVSGLASGVIAIAAGVQHTCALTSSGGVKCWGRNNAGGALGDGTQNNSSLPVDVIGLASSVIAIGAASNFSCALTIAGGVKCWGANYEGQLGDGTTISPITPVNVIGLTSDVSMIALSADHTCALTTGGGVKCWGRNQNGQLGDGTTITRNIPVDVIGLTSGVSAIAVGSSNTCALMSSGGVKCWGFNGYGQLGNGTSSNLTAGSLPVNVIGLTSDVSRITVGGDHTCVLTSIGAVKCWGANFAGQLGIGTSDGFAHPIPVDVSGLTNSVSSIAAGRQHTCALMTSTDIKCWGINQEGQLGDGTTMTRNSPVDVIEVPIPPDQIIIVTTNAPTHAVEGSSFTVAAISSSGLPVTYSASGVCTNVNAIFTMTSGTGTCTVMYDQAGNVNYDPAPQVVEYVTASINTPAGNNIRTQPIDTNGGTTPVTLTFAQVTRGGTTSLTTSSSGPLSPTGFKLGNPPTYYELSTTATFVGPVTLCINYTGISVSNESNLKLHHYENGAWVDRTISLDTTKNIICASITSLSPFAIFEPSVTYNFSGFLAPVDNPDTVNTGKAGKTYPVKWQLTDSDGAFISDLSLVTITYNNPSCGAFTGDPVDVLETSTTGGTSLSYHSGANQFIYNWATPSAAGCYTLFLNLDNGDVYYAFFDLK
jgi:alpha-tubulin suppressor-like RCC1 family protein